MAKLYFKFGAMKSGKTRDLIKTWYNYNEKDLKVIIIKPESDKKAGDNIQSRAKEELKANYVVPSDSNLYELVFYHTIKYNPIDCILVDEAQFLTKDQITELFVITKIKEVPVICYGLKIDYRSELFEGSKRLLELADEIEELKTICSCGTAARFNARYDKKTNEFVSEGEQVVIDGDNRYGYKPLCGKCYLEKVSLPIYDEEV